MSTYATAHLGGNCVLSNPLLPLKAKSLQTKTRKQSRHVRSQNDSARKITCMHLKVDKSSLTAGIVTGALAVALGAAPAAWAAGDTRMFLDNALLELQNETLPELIEENIQFDRDTLFNKEDSQLFPEELKEKRRQLVNKDEAVAYLEIFTAFAILRKELFIYGLISLVPAVMLYLKKKKELDEYNQDVEETYKPWSTGKRTEVKGKPKDKDSEDKSKK
mmetsp:Transcript_3391/g.5792  ORF Transcript_3391/g.5792 Transcript_3391/m.5792 type:complete len:219 (+) Transcript_3391:62-718(+)|eukprot:CAMPEP_0198209382 /NCGR_PEP_ID=MMETSP1445-20131203/15404_1 /TAXON_ID=36898 /ORGANISM="Pyramimonas sp., Strain CCMP2087" /LENGTH=218 /DNA_ID=CAMNT_0043883149 /DNA_START=56 /DNA_END=712 /DNA_ORIENTATION=+